MKPFKTLLVLLVCFSVSSAAFAADNIRTVADIPGLPLAVLKRTLSKPFTSISLSRLLKAGSRCADS